MYDDKKKNENDNEGFGLYLNHEGVKFGYGNRRYCKNFLCNRK